MFRVDTFQNENYKDADQSARICRLVCVFVVRKPPKTVFYGEAYIKNFFCSGIQFNLLLSPYPCFISLLYLDLYVLGNDALIS